MADQIDVYNIALNILGMKEVTGTSQVSPSVDVLNTFYQPALRELFEECPWSFATTKESLISVSDTVLEYEWKYIYAKPVKAVNIWAIYDESTVKTKYENTFELVYQPEYNREVICTDLADALCEYAYVVTDTRLFSPKFVIALGHKLAAYAAPQLVTDAKKRLDVINAAMMFIEQAKTYNFQRKQKKHDQTSKYKSAR